MTHYTYDEVCWSPTLDKTFHSLKRLQSPIISYFSRLLPLHYTQISGKLHLKLPLINLLLKVINFLSHV